MVCSLQALGGLAAVDVDALSYRQWPCAEFQETRVWSGPRRPESEHEE
jgi:hypothetical protein